MNIRSLTAVPLALQIVIFLLQNRQELVEGSIVWTMLNMRKLPVSWSVHLE